MRYPLSLLLALTLLGGCASQAPTTQPRTSYQEALYRFDFVGAQRLLLAQKAQGDKRAARYLADQGEWLAGQVVLQQASPQTQAEQAKTLILQSGSQMSDFREAAHWAKSAAQAGNPQGQYWLGWLLEKGQGFRQNPHQASYWYQQAAQQGLACAQRQLALLLENGALMVPDLQEAAHWYGAAARQGDPLAQLNLGQLYLQGRGVPQDLGQAEHWYQQAAEQGEAKAQYQLGMLLHLNQGLPLDSPQPRYWLQKAAEQGNVQALDTLSTL